MGKFGKKKDVDLNPLHYSTCLIGLSGVGKTTIAKEMCEKLCGEDGYIHFDIGREDGADAIQGIVTEKIEDWAKLVEVTEDIIENKETDYPNLQCIIWDTFDELIVLAEKEAIRLWNKKNPDKKSDSINAIYGGFGKGQDKAMELILDRIWELKKVGISAFIIGHLKRTDITDPVTNETYSQLTADTTQRYFNAIRNKMHFIGVAYIDRDIVKEKTGKKNVVTHKDIEINKVVSEARVISFRDDTYSIDSKSRFSDIVDKIPFDCDAFIKAMQDAIEAERAKSGKTLAESQKEQAEKDRAAEEAAKEYSDAQRTRKVDAERNDELISIIKPKFLKTTAENKAAVKDVMSEYGFEKFTDPDIPTVALEKIVQILS
ncbi:AAA family ATPase [Bacillota bacterium HCP28S3_F12]